ncbi:FAD-dependent oxidoreductase [Marinagarivorans algicola]|uniref:FAD-dependent oxidoreductase n=1 Tax=Marinagarivorans algicola TaxID=1513270 RepID=UPI0006B8ACE5|nr:FAD-dependent oxidoreductase [Marinagarivorans algicola]
MSLSSENSPIVVIGGGFYGVCIACYLVESRGFKDVTLLDREHELMQRASYTNQARVHNGYHYPRSFTTAYRSRVNLPRFVKDWPNAVDANFTKLYAIAKRGSKVTAKQFERFCNEIKAEIEAPLSSHEQLFNPDLIEKVYKVKEYAFNTTRLADWARLNLKKCGVKVCLNSNVKSIIENKTGNYTLQCEVAGKPIDHIGRYIFNCTYSGLNTPSGDFLGVETKLKHEITEMTLVDMPDELKDIGVTVMDGPFFSFMPFPARGYHSLSHVRYTPHCSWVDDNQINPYKKLENYKQESRIDRMIRDVARYMPKIACAEHKDSLFEVKTILVKNEGDDGRPILLEKNKKLPGVYSVLGGKIDNIYDVLEKLDTEVL